MIIGIVAADRDWAIGKQNGLLYKLKEDMKLFTEKTKNKIVACGENTLLSFPNSKPLKGRSTLVLCKEGHEYENCICFSDFDKFVSALKVLSITNDVYIIGGGMLYKSMLPYYDEVFVNKINAEDPEATVFFPNMDNEPDFYLSNIGAAVEDGDYITRLYTYKRKNIIPEVSSYKASVAAKYDINLDNIEIFEEALMRS